MSIHEKIKAARIAKGMSMESLAAAVSKAEGLAKPLAWQTVQQWESGKSAPKRLRLEVVAKLLGLPVAELVGEAEQKSWNEEVDLDNHPDLVRIRRVKLRLEAGVNGIAVEPDDEDGLPIFFRADWMRLRGYKPYNLVAVKVHGSSMEPNLYPDDMVVVNTADREPKDGKVFAVNYEGESVIKRMARENGTWWLTSDNQDQRRFPRKECTGPGCILIGLVIHKQSELI